MTTENTTVTVTVEKTARTMPNDLDLEDIAAELLCISGNITCVAALVTPNPDMQNASMPSQKSINEAFDAITNHIVCVADKLNRLARLQMDSERK